MGFKPRYLDTKACFDCILLLLMLPCGLMVKNVPANARDAGDEGLIFGLGRHPREGKGNPLQYSCLENPMNRGVLQATVHGVAQLRN